MAGPLPKPLRYVDFLELSSREKDTNMADWKIPFGRAQGELLHETDEENIKWALGAIEKKLAEDPNGTFAGKNKAWIVAARAELKSRESGGGQLAHRPAAAPIQRVAPPVLGAAMNDPAAVTAHLRQLAVDHHIVSPATNIDVLPPGCGVAVNYVLVDPSTEKGGPKEVYAIGDALGLSGTTLAKIGAAAGVDWDASQSGRLDNGSDPHYCHFRAVGHVRNFDLSHRTITGEVELDARENSPQIEEIRTKAGKRKKKGPNDFNDGGASQILELRKFLLRHAESKAKNRAIASMGLKRSYSEAELQKPFAVCRLMFTGKTDNPEYERMFAEKTADAMIGGMVSLYGRPAPQPAPAPHALSSAPQRGDASAPRFEGHAPPPVLRVNPAAVSAGSIDDHDYGGDYEPESEKKPNSGSSSATSGSATATPVPNPQSAVKKPNYAEGEADL